jgi:hypothetical protein
MKYYIIFFVVLIGLITLKAEKTKVACDGECSKKQEGHCRKQCKKNGMASCCTFGGGLSVRCCCIGQMCIM